MNKAPDGLDYVADFLSGTEQDALLHELYCLIYTHDKFRDRIMKRGYAQFGQYYVAAGRKLVDAPPIPPFLQAVIEKAAPYYPQGIEFAQCIATWYPCNAGIGWHTDAPRFGDYILAISLASPARLQFRPNKSKAVSFEITATPGSLYVMHGIARWQYQHRIIPVKVERYSLTFRSVSKQ
jgi:alkylated DNA repair protein (DNA oxidative demethylase)